MGVFLTHANLKHLYGQERTKDLDQQLFRSTVTDSNTTNNGLWVNKMSLKETSTTNGLLCCGQRSLQWTKMWTKAYFTRLSNSALPLVSSLALTGLVLHLYNAFTFPLRYSKFTLLFDSSTFLSAFGQLISSAFFGQTQNMSCCLLPGCAPKITADFDSGSKN